MVIETKCFASTIFYKLEDEEKAQIRAKICIQIHVHFVEAEAQLLIKKKTRRRRRAQHGAKGFSFLRSYFSEGSNTKLFFNIGRA